MTYPVSQFCAVNIVALPLLLVNYGHFALGTTQGDKKKPEVVYYYIPSSKLLSTPHRPLWVDMD